MAMVDRKIGGAMVDNASTGFIIFITETHHTDDEKEDIQKNDDDDNNNKQYVAKMAAEEIFEENLGVRIR